MYDISWGYNSDVSRIVRGLTSWSKQIKSTAKRAERKKMDLEYLTKQGSDVHQIKLIDRFDNLNSLYEDAIGGVVEDSFVRLYVQETDKLVETIGKPYTLLSAQVTHVCDKLLIHFGYAP